MITIDRGPTVQVEGWQLTLLIKRTCISHLSHRMISARLSREPVAVILQRGDDIRAFDLGGGRLTLEAIKQLGWEDG